MLDIAVHMAEQPVHRRTPVGAKLDPQRGHRDLPVDPLRRILEGDSVGDPQTGSGDCLGGAIERRLAVAGDQDRGSIESVFGS